ncbi:metallopeptidase family protein [Janibacter sp. GXQ6167]|uniref:metallopeptidase family protein n=1 Tax=Janibacter sp. GXQ6167 TaxID=3240791 RepID=UPI0035249DB0
MSEVAHSPFVDDDAFDQLVEAALAEVPSELMALTDNVAIFVEPEPSAEHGDRELLGIYEGVPLTERDGGWAMGALPDRILLFRGPLRRMARDAEELYREVAITVVHEVAHHFGIDDAALHDLGWG